MRPPLLRLLNCRWGDYPKYMRRHSRSCLRDVTAACSVIGKVRCSARRRRRWHARRWRRCPVCLLHLAGFGPEAAG